MLAQSVAIAWKRIRDLAAQESGGRSAGAIDQNDHGGVGIRNDDVAQAIVVTAQYNEADVCTACMSVPTGILSWHIPDIISTWPDRTVDYALAALADDRHINEGIDDIIHSTVLRTHEARPSRRSDEVLDVATDLLMFLEAELREVLVYELCAVGVNPMQLLDVLSSFERDADDGVRRTAVVGITKALLREAQHPSASEVADDTSRMQAWCQFVRGQLCAYGRAMDEDRQNAWIAMLMMRDYDLIDGVEETLGKPGAPGVRLTDIFGAPDDLLVNLVVSNWDGLERHFGDELLDRLSGGRFRVTESSSIISAVRSLALAADKDPSVNQLVAQFRDAGRGDTDGLNYATTLASTEEHADESLIRALEALEFSSELTDWTARQGGSGSEVVRLLLNVNDSGSGGPHRREANERWAVSRLLDKSWHRLDNAELREALTSHRSVGDWDSDRAWLHPTGCLERAAWAMLSPQSDEVRLWADGLARWFTDTRRGIEEPSSWLEVCALVFGASPAADLPVLVSRVLHPGRMQYLRDIQWKITIPLSHRLRNDPEAVGALRHSLAGNPVPTSSPFFRDSVEPNMPADQGTHGTEFSGHTIQPDRLMRRVFAAANALSYAGHLRPDDLTTALEVLQHSDTRSIVYDPYLEQSEPLWVAGVRLLRALNR